MFVLLIRGRRLQTPQTAPRTFCNSSISGQQDNTINLFDKKLQVQSPLQSLAASKRHTGPGNVEDECQICKPPILTHLSKQNALNNIRHHLTFMWRVMEVLVLLHVLADQVE